MTVRYNRMMIRGMVVVLLIAGSTTGCGRLPVPGASMQTADSAAPMAYWAWATRPPMGWNSWDAFATTVTEAQVRAQADYMAERLARYGWEYVVVDIQWYEPAATGFHYRKNAALVMDAYGRLQPATNKFPSASGGSGFRPLGDYLHAKGLKFGVHLMRGIPRQAVAQNTPVLGTTYRAADIADTTSTCPWNTDMFGVDMTRPGAQAYYNSVFQQLAAWGVDFVKVDDLSRPYHRREIEGIREAIDRAGRPMVLSTSPGETPLADADHVSRHANMWRMSDDFWDTWPALLEQFERTRKWAPYIGAGHFPDADMLPLGAIRSAPGYDGGNWTRFTKDEQYTMMTLWSIARSPLIMGGDMTRNDAFTLSLLTNAEVIAVNQESSGNRQLFNRAGHIAWVAEVPGSSDVYLAVFNATDTDAERDTTAKVALKELGVRGAYSVRDLWQRKDLGAFTEDFAPHLPRHGAALYRVARVQ
jgi:alpha-galactosidase